MSTAAGINQRFANGVPTDDTWRAGVFIHQSDSQSSWAAPWAPVASGALSDRMAASVVNRKWPYVFSTSAIGFVLHPLHVAGAVRCSYAKDGNSMNTEPGGCGGRDVYMGGAALARMMLRDTPPWDWHCSLGATPDDRSGCRYNEVRLRASNWSASVSMRRTHRSCVRTALGQVVIDGTLWSARLPAIVEAVFFPVHGVVKVWEGVWPEDARAQLETARRVHQAFLSMYQRTALEVPLLSYDQAVAERGGEAPFKLVDDMRHG